MKIHSRLAVGSSVAWLGTLGVLAVLSVLSMALGASENSLASNLQAMLNKEQGDGGVLLNLRLPRTIAAILLGAALAVAGSLMQSLTRNRLAEPGLLGVNAGAALGVVLGMTFGMGESGLARLPWALAGALLANAFVVAAGVRTRHSAPLRLVLLGVALSASFQGLSSTLLLSNSNYYDQYRFWLLGSLAGITPSMLQALAPSLLFALVASFALARPLASLGFGDEGARSLGQRPALLRASVASFAALLCAASVALAGPIAFMGLLAPFVARQLRPKLFTQHELSQRGQLLFCASVGAALLLLTDISARLVAMPFETPISVMSACLGAPLLIYLARNRRSQVAA